MAHAKAQWRKEEKARVDRRTEGEDTGRGFDAWGARRSLLIGQRSIEIGPLVGDDCAQHAWRALPGLPNVRLCTQAVAFQLKFGRGALGQPALPRADGGGVVEES